MFQPDKEWIESSNVYKFMVEKGFNTLDEFIKYTYDNPSFWEDFVKLIGLKFYKKYEKYWIYQEVNNGQNGLLMVS